MCNQSLHKYILQTPWLDHWVNMNAIMSYGEQTVLGHDSFHLNTAKKKKKKTAVLIELKVFFRALTKRKSSLRFNDEEDLGPESDFAIRFCSYNSGKSLWITYLLLRNISWPTYKKE